MLLVHFLDVRLAGANDAQREVITLQDVMGLRKNEIIQVLNPLTLRAAKRGLKILEIFNLQTHILKNI